MITVFELLILIVILASGVLVVCYQIRSRRRKVPETLRNLEQQKRSNSDELILKLYESLLALEPLFMTFETQQKGLYLKWYVLWLRLRLYSSDFPTDGMGNEGEWSSIESILSNLKSLTQQNKLSRFSNEAQTTVDEIWGEAHDARRAIQQYFNRPA